MPKPPSQRGPARQEGFPGQQIAVLPISQQKNADLPVIDGLLPTAAGYFPRAEGHHVRRDKPITDAIFLLCVEGAGWLSIDRQRSAVHAGQVGYVPAGRVHAYGSAADTPWSLAWFHAAGQRVAAAAESIGLSPARPVAEIGQLDQDLPLINALCHLLGPPRQEARLRLASAEVRKWFARAAMRLPGIGHEPGLIERIDQSIAWMRDNLDRPIRLIELASQARLSVSRYSEVFRKLHGQPPIAYCTACRVQRAAELMATTPQTVAEIAAQVGYDDPLHFSRVFRKHMGQPPRAYRERSRA